MTGLPSVNSQEFMQFPGFPELKWGYRILEGFSKDKLVVSTWVVIFCQCGVHSRPKLYTQDLISDPYFYFQSNGSILGQVTACEGCRYLIEYIPEVPWKPIELNLDLGGCGEKTFKP